MGKPEAQPSPTGALLAYLSQGHHRRHDGEPFTWEGRTWLAAEVAFWLGELERTSEVQHAALLRAMRPRVLRQDKAALAAHLGVGSNTLHRHAHRGLVEIAMGMGLR